MVLRSKNIDGAICEGLQKLIISRKIEPVCLAIGSVLGVDFTAVILATGACVGGTVNQQLLTPLYPTNHSSK